MFRTVILAIAVGAAFMGVMYLRYSGGTVSAPETTPTPWPASEVVWRSFRCAYATQYPAPPDTPCESLLAQVSPRNCQPFSLARVCSRGELGILGPDLLNTPIPVPEGLIDPNTVRDESWQVTIAIKGATGVGETVRISIQNMDGRIGEVFPVRLWVISARGPKFGDMGLVQGSSETPFEFLRVAPDSYSVYFTGFGLEQTAHTFGHTSFQVPTKHP